MIMHAFKDYHFLELQDDNGDIVGYTAIELFDLLMDQYVQPEDVADQVTVLLHKTLEQNYDPIKSPKCTTNWYKMQGTLLNHQMKQLMRQSNPHLSWTQSVQRTY